MDTKSRVIEAATTAFSERGFAGTSLDDLAKMVGLTKQSILYHFGSKDGLLEAVLTDAVGELASVLETAATSSARGLPRIEAAVRASFGLAVSRPELLGLLREVSRLGAPRSDVVMSRLAPLIDEALVGLQRCMDDGLLRQSDPQILLASSYAAVTGVVTDAGALGAVGLELDLRVAARLRRTVLDFLRAAVEDEGP